LKNIELPVVVHRVVMPWDSQSGSRPGEIHPARGTKSQSLVTPVAARFGWVAVLVLLAAGLGWWFAHPSGSETKQPAVPPAVPMAAPATDQKSIAVLPFVNMSADKADEYLSDGMTEELLNVLAQVKGLRVPGRSSSFAFKGRNDEDIFQKVGEQLHVSTVLEGSVRKAGNKLRVTAQLINVADGFHLWSESYDGDMKDIFAFQSSVARRVVEALQVQLGVQEAQVLAKKPTENPEAYRLYLLGRYQFAKATTTGWTNAMNDYHQAAQLDPAFSLAYCGLADGYGWDPMLMPGKEAWAKEKELAQKALALDPNLPDAHLSLAVALLSVFDWQGGGSEINRALELNPNLALAYDQSGWLLTARGRFDEAIAAQKKALALDPLSPMMNLDLGHYLVEARRYDDAIGPFRQALELDPNIVGAYDHLAWIFLLKGDAAAAIAEFQKAGQIRDHTPSTDAGLGYAYAISGNRAKAGQILRELQDLAKRRYVAPGVFITIYLGLGEKDKVLDLLDQCYEEQDGICWFLKVNPILDSVRNEPRFQSLLKKMNFPP